MVGVGILYVSLFVPTWFTLKEGSENSFQNSLVYDLIKKFLVSLQFYKEIYMIRYFNIIRILF